MVLAASAASDAAPGVLGFLVVAGMGIVLYFLFRSMAKHLRKVSADPRQDPVVANSRAAGGSVAGGGVATGSRASDNLANGGLPDGSVANGGVADSGADS